MGMGSSLLCSAVNSHCFVCNSDEKVAPDSEHTFLHQSSLKEFRYTSTAAEVTRRRPGRYDVMQRYNVAARRCDGLERLQ